LINLIVSIPKWENSLSAEAPSPELETPIRHKSKTIVQESSTFVLAKVAFPPKKYGRNLANPASTSVALLMTDLVVKYSTDCLACVTFLTRNLKSLARGFR
jgi:hypothetical protein